MLNKLIENKRDKTGGKTRENFKLFGFYVTCNGHGT